MIKGIGLIRFSLAMTVAFFHFFHFTAFKLLEQLAAGIFGVCLFFVLSGFLVTNMVIKNAYVEKPKRFVLNRALRIYPTYFFTLAIAFLLIPAAADHFHAQIGRYSHLQQSATYGSTNVLFLDIANWWSFFWTYIALFFRNTNLYPVGDWNPVLWTIDVELRAYLLMTLILLGWNTLAGKRMINLVRDGKLNGWIALATICFLGALLIDWVSVLLSPAGGGNLLHSKHDFVALLKIIFDPEINAGGLVYFLPLFLIGGMLALRRIFWPVFSAKYLSILVIVAAALYWNYLRIQTPVSINFGLFDTLVFITGLITIIWFIFQRPSLPTILQKLDGIAGDASYPLYLLNFPVVFALAHGGKIGLSSVWVALAGTMLLTALCLLFVERPLRRIRVSLTEGQSIR
jgi:peptidoglycan/LPS O-acetylase OafA/YrhL